MLYVSETSKTEMEGCKFERVGDFKYLGALITDKNENNMEIKARIAAGNRAYFSFLNLLKSKIVSRKTKLTIYRTVIRPVVLYGSETWTMTVKDERDLNIWERKVLRKVFGPVNDNGEWRIRSNLEIRALYNRPDLVAEVKKRRLRWLGHLERMDPQRTAKKIYSRVPEGTRSIGRPRKRWLDDIEKDLKSMGVIGWKRKAQDRSQWREILSQAQVLQGP